MGRISPKLPNVHPLLFPVSFLGAMIGGIVMLKDFLAGEKYTGDERIAGRTAIVTGANSGIGKETAHLLAARGGRVIMACRNMTACEKARSEIVENTFNKNVHCRHLDLASLKSVRDFAAEVKKDERRLDILVNNAGVMQSDQSYTEDGFELQFGVNHLGHFLLTNLLLENLKASAPSRIVFVQNYIAQGRGVIDFDDLNSSENYDVKKAYFQSKLAQFYFIKELGKVLKGTEVGVYAAHPGIVRTNLGRHLTMEKSWISSMVLGPLWWLTFRKASEGAQTPLYCAICSDIKNEQGKCYSDCHELPKYDSVQLDNETSHRLWLISQLWTGLTNTQVKDNSSHTPATAKS